MANSRRVSVSNALARITGINLDTMRAAFVFEYTFDYQHRRAAEAIGAHPDDGMKLLAEPEVQEAVRHVYNYQMQASDLTAETIKEEMYALYKVAVQDGKLSVAAKLLDQLARHSHIDAYAAQRIAVSADAEVAQKLQSGRQRAREASLRQNAVDMSEIPNAPRSFL